MKQQMTMQLVIASISVLASTTVPAESQYYDCDPLTAAIDGGTGNWGDSNWKASADGTTGSAWADGKAARFEPIAGVPSTTTLALSGTALADGVWFSGAGYSISGGTLDTGTNGFVLTQPATVDASLVRLLVYGTAELSIGGGGTISTPAVIGRSGESSSVRQTGGNIDISSWLLIGGNNAAGASGEYILDSGTLTVSNGLSIGWGSATSYGTFTHNSGTVETKDNSQGIQLGRAGGHGTYNLNGGTLISTFGTGATPYTYQSFNFGGGLLKARGTTSAQSTMATVIADGQSALIDTQSYTVTFPGMLSGAAAAGLIKSGAGKLTLSAANTYAGVTFVSNGTLRVQNTSGSGTGSSSVRVLNNAVLEGSGTVTGAVEVAEGGALSGGKDGSGTLTLTRTPTLATNARLRIAANAGGTSCGILHTNGDLDLSKLTLEIESLAQLKLGTYVIATCDGTLTGPFAALALPASYSVAYDYSAKTVRVIRGNLYVSPDGNDGNSGTSWLEAKATIQAAVEAVGYNGTVLVTNGVYATGNYENHRVLITNNVTLRSVVPHGAIIRGSGSATYGTAAAIRCVYMDGSSLLDGFILEDGATFASSKEATSGGGLVIKGLLGLATNCVIRNCKAFRGGGAYWGVMRECVLTNNIAEESGGGNDNGYRYNCTISHNTAANGGGIFYGKYYDCLISDNIATNKGGGGFGGSYPPSLYNCTIRNNTAKQGGGFNIGFLYDCVIENNIASESGGGGAYNANLTRCIIRNNTCAGGDDAGGGGGASQGTLSDCLIASNQAIEGSGGGTYGATLYRCQVLSNEQSGTGNGGGMVGGTAYSTLIANNRGQSVGGTWLTSLYSCTVANNTATLENGPGIHYGGQSIVNTLAYGNTGGQNLDISGLTEFSAISYTVAGSADMVHAGITLVPVGAPVFAAPAQGDFGLCPGSPAINAGSNALNPTNNTLDLARNTRIRFGTINAGAYEFITLCASPNGSDANDGLSWGAAKTLQGAINAAENGFTVLATNGIYNSGTSATPVSGSTLNRVVITNAITVKSLSGAEQTVIQGEGALNVAGATRCVFMNNGILDGFTLEKGVTISAGGTHEYGRGGGGVCIMNAAPGTTVKNCVIRNNKSTTGGGVTGGQAGTFDIYTYKNNATIMDCIITNNTASYGGGIAYYATFDECLIEGNSAGSGGGAYDVKQGVNNSLLRKNTGCGVYIGQLNNCTVTENTGGGVMGLRADQIAYINNSIVWGNSAWEINPNGFAVSANAYTSNPSFRDAVNGDYRLIAASPCVNAGDNAKSVGTLDLAGRERIAFGTVDIGAYELPESVRVVFDVSPGIYKDTLSEAMEVLVPSTNQVYGSYFPTNAVYLSGHVPAKWSSFPAGAGTEITDDSDLLSLDDHTIYLQWKVMGLSIIVR